MMREAAKWLAVVAPASLAATGTVLASPTRQQQRPAGFISNVSGYLRVVCCIR
jgi:hypothetical protein